uniref:FecR family protein n=1 Tax=uncultured Draconibacterium sp. TaxID=1573823 RepID=UPI003217CD58
MEEQKHYDADKAWEQVSMTATRKQRKRIAVGVGSSALTVVLVFFLLIPLLQTTPEVELLTEEEFTGRKIATLYMAEGPTVELSDSLDHSLDQIIIQKKITPLNKTVKNKIKKNVLEVPTGGEYYFELPDGTKVWLNSKTRLEFPSEFNGNTREIALNGQAYFDVVHNPEKPFIVRTELGNVEVKGTSFDLKVYDNDRTFETTLVEGSVSLAITDRPNTLIYPGQRSVYSEESRELITSDVDVRLYTSWKEGIFYFENKSLAEVTKELERWYEVSFTFKDENAKSIRYTGEYRKNQNLDEILRLLSITGNVEFKNDGESIAINTSLS